MFSSMLRNTGICLFALLFLTGASTAEHLKIDASHSNVTFSIRHIVSQVRGSFTDFSGTIHYDQKNPGKSTVEATIKTASINTNNGRRDDHLRSPDFFDAEKYPTITFKSTKAVKKGDKLMVTGNFTMHGTTKEITIPVEVLGVGTHPMTKAPVAGFVGELTILRSDYGVNSWTDAAGILGDEVKIALNIEAAGMGKGANPCNPCAAKNACNPCAAKKNPCNPCAK